MWPDLELSVLKDSVFCVFYTVISAFNVLLAIVCQRRFLEGVSGFPTFITAVRYGDDVLPTARDQKHPFASYFVDDTNRFIIVSAATTAKGLLAHKWQK